MHPCRSIGGFVVFSEVIACLVDFYFFNELFLRRGIIEKILIMPLFRLETRNICVSGVCLVAYNASQTVIAGS